MTQKKLSTRSPFVFNTYCIRNITSPEDANSNRKIYVGQAPLGSILTLPTEENVRDYLLASEGKKRKVPTQVHRAIRDTLENSPENFTVLNGGIVIVARGCEVGKDNKDVSLLRPSIINGSQTQGIIKDLLDSLDEESKKQFLSYHVKFELIVVSDEELIADVSISRNFQNDVMTISIAGRLGQLEELEENFQKSGVGKKLQKSETMLTDDFIKTERLLQIIAALVPKELLMNESISKVYAYNQKTKCLREFQEIYKKAKDTGDKDHQRHLDLYNFYLDIAGEAWALYEKWKSHPGFYGTRIQSIKRDKKNNIKDVPDGLIFPILASLSVFATKVDGTWSIKTPDSFDDEELIRSAKSVYIDMANSTPHIMGKSKACYSALYQITEIYKRLSV